MTSAQKEGAVIFFGSGSCARCHGGALLSDQAFHNIAIPQFGPGNAAGVDSSGSSGEVALHHDFGRFGRTLIASDKFLFRTPSLHEVALTAPYMHDGCFSSLEAAVEHYMGVQSDFSDFSDFGSLQVIPQSLLVASLGGGPVIQDPISTTNLDPIVVNPIISNSEVSPLVTFMQSLTDPDAQNLQFRGTIRAVFTTQPQRSSYLGFV